MIRVNVIMYGDYIPPWSRSVCRYVILGIPVEVIPILHRKRVLIDFRMMRIKAGLSLRVCLEVTKHVEYLLEMYPVR